MNRIARTLLTVAVLGLVYSVAAQPFVITNLWTAYSNNPATPYVTIDHTQRGLAYSPETGHLLVATRNPNRILILDSETGASNGVMSGVNLLAGGTYALNLIGVGEDGAVYAANLVAPISESSPLRVYRWASEDATTPVQVYSGWPGGSTLYGTRIGDSLAVRGSGLNTEILMGTGLGSGGTGVGTNVLLLKPEGGVTNFVATVIPTDAPNDAIKLSVAWGHSNTFWGKVQNQNLRRFRITESAEKTNAVTLNSIAVGGSPAGVGFSPANNLLALVFYTATSGTTNLVIYDAANLPTLTPLATNVFLSAVRNINAATYAVFAPDKCFGLNCNNGIVAARVINLSSVPTPPEIQAQPVGGQILEGGRHNGLQVTVRGSYPFYYQWHQNDVALPDATNALYAITEASTEQSGAYFVIVTNLHGAATSDVARVTVRTVLSDALTPIWSLAPGSHDWLQNDNHQRGLAYNKVSGHVLVVSHTPSNLVAVLDGGDGALLHYLNAPSNIVTGGTYPLNMIGVDDAGVVYACNLKVAGSAEPFRIYRWATDEVGLDPTVAFTGDAGGGTAVRWGDCMDVRGSDVETQILLGSRDHNVVSVFTVPGGDPTVFSPTLITVADAPPGSFGLGVAWAEGNAFWGKAPSAALRKVSLDLPANTGQVLLAFDPSQFPGTIYPLAVDLENNFLAGIAVESPQNLRLFDLANVGPDSPPLYIDTEFFPTDNQNANGTGAADFGSGRLYALDSNNGIMAFIVKRPTGAPTLSAARQGNSVILTFTGVLQSKTNVVEGAWADVPGAVSPHTVDATTEPVRFYRARQ